MSMGSATPVGDVEPTDAWQILRDNPRSVLIDVRTRAEWGFVGVPDLTGLHQPPIFIEWAAFPGMSKNPRFVAEVKEAVGPLQPDTYLFLCRSGVRSLHAAHAVASDLSATGQAATCLNVMEGFEGDLDPQGQRGSLNGWKARGLAWRQS
ncbi:MAG: rhodanese-like domain-containing protein [Pseudomonadota bacterium]